MILVPIILGFLIVNYANGQHHTIIYRVPGNTKARITFSNWQPESMVRVVFGSTFVKYQDFKLLEQEPVNSFKDYSPIPIVKRQRFYEGWKEWAAKHLPPRLPGRWRRYPLPDPEWEAPVQINNGDIIPNTNLIIKEIETLIVKSLPTPQTSYIFADFGQITFTLLNRDHISIKVETEALSEPAVRDLTFGGSYPRFGESSDYPTGSRDGTKWSNGGRNWSKSGQKRSKSGHGESSRGAREPPGGPHGAGEPAWQELPPYAAFQGTAG